MQLDDDLKLLGVRRGASQQEIRKAYKRLCLVYHPDKRGTAHDFIQLNEAYNRLMNAPQDDADSINFYKKMFEIFQQYILDLLKNNVATSQQSSDVVVKKSPPVVIRLPVTLEDLVTKAVKRVVVKVSRQGHEEKEVLYISLLNYQTSYIVEGKGDECAPLERGDVHIELDILPHPLLSVSTTSKYNLVCTRVIGLADYLTGYHETIDVFGKPAHITYTGTEDPDAPFCQDVIVRGAGIPFVTDEDENDNESCGDLVVTLQLALHIKDGVRTSSAGGFKDQLDAIFEKGPFVKGEMKNATHHTP